MIDKMRIDEFYLHRDGFSPLKIRKVTLVDGSYFYEFLAYSHPHYLSYRWEKINLPNADVELQIEKYKTCK